MKALKYHLALGLSAFALISNSAFSRESVPTLARDLVNNTTDVLRLSQQLGDYGYAYYDLENLQRSTVNFSYTLSWNDFAILRDSFQRSRYSWPSLRSYHSDPRKFQWIEGDMRELELQMHPAPHIITLTSQGSGGTTVGDKPAACERAQERAQFNLVEQCSQSHGNLLQFHFSSCRCRHISGQKYDCDMDAYGDCEIH